MEAMNMLSSLTSSFSSMSCKNGRMGVVSHGVYTLSKGADCPTDLKAASSAVLADDTYVWWLRAGANEGANIIVSGIPQLKVKRYVSIRGKNKPSMLTSFNSFFISRVISTLFFRTFLMAYSCPLYSPMGVKMVV